MELLLVFAVLCIMMDSLLVNLYTYYKPLGFDITNVYKVNIGKMSPGNTGICPGFVAYDYRWRRSGPFG